MLTPRQLLLGSFPGMRFVPCPEKRAILRYIDVNGFDQSAEYQQVHLAYFDSLGDVSDSLLLDKWEFGLRRMLEDMGIGRNSTIVWRVEPEIDRQIDVDSGAFIYKFYARFAVIPYDACIPREQE